MKLNQYGRIVVDLDTEKSELSAIGFDTSKDTLASALSANAPRLFPEARSTTTKKQALANLAVTADKSLDELIAEKPEKISREDFYALSLQLLGFEPLSDFEFEEAVAFMKKTSLPVVDGDIESANDFYHALYLLLNTRTKRLILLIDELARRGFYRDFQDGKKTPLHLFFNGKAQNVFDARRIHREVVWVESDMDTDGDGQRDLLETTIFRPFETDSGTKMPVLFTANPYFHGTNDVEAVTHKPSDTLAVKPAGTKDVHYEKKAPVDLPHRPVNGESREAEVYADEDGIYPLNDYFLGRGFATVYSAGVGTRGSDGVRSTGGVTETDSAVAVIEWLTGKRRAFTNRHDGIEIKAWWSNGKVAMTGKSYLGTLAIAAATSGVSGLKTVISESAISSWYDYYRENGLVVAPGGFQGEDADVLAVDTYSRQKNTADFLRMKQTWEKALKQIEIDQDREFGDYSAWWDERNYRNDLKNIKADIVSTHGLNDWNVKPANVIRFWNGIRDLPIAKKLFLHQGQHTYVNNIRSLDFTDMMNLWLSYELLGVENGAKDALPNVTVQDNVEEETWHTYADFASEDSQHETRRFNLEQDFKKVSSNEFVDDATEIFNQHKSTSDAYELEIVKPTSDYDDSRIWLDLPAFDETITLEGIARLSVTLAIDAPAAILSARLVDVGDAKRLSPVASTVDFSGYALGYDYKTTNILEFKKAKKTASKLISFGHINVQNQKNAYTATTVEPGVPFTIDFDLQPTHYVLPKNRHLALIIHGADMAQTQRPTKKTRYEIDLKKSFLELPFRI